MTITTYSTPTAVVARPFTDIPNGGTITVAYPLLLTQASFIGDNAGDVADQVCFVGQDKYRGATIAVSYGASNVIVTNNTGVTWNAGSRLSFSFPRIDRSYNGPKQVSPDTALVVFPTPTAQGGPGAAVPDTTGKVYTATGLKVGSTAILYGNGTQISSVTVDGTGKATWTLGAAPAAGVVITFDGVVTGSGGTVPTPGTVVTLNALSLSASSFTAGAAAGTVIGAVQGLTSGSTLSLQASNGNAVALSGNNLTVGASAPTQAGTFSITLRETLPGATNTPRDTALTITVAAASVILGALGISAASATVGTAYTGTISGQTSGSTLSLTGTGAAGLSVSGATISGTPTTAGAVNVVETLSGATNSPRTTSGLITVAAAAQTATTTALAASNTAPSSGASVTLTATVAPSAATGTVTFKDGTTTLGTGTLSGGVATYSTSALAAGAHSITAVYGGGSAYSGSTSAVVTVTVAAPAAGPNPPAGNVSITDADGSYLTDPDGAYFYEAA